MEQCITEENILHDYMFIHFELTALNLNDNQIYVLGVCVLFLLFYVKGYFFNYK